MSSPPLPGPSPWLTLAMSVVASLGLSAASGFVQYGRADAKLEAVERRQERAEAKLETVVTQQSAASRETGEVKAELNGMKSEMTRLANAMERLASRP